MFSCCRCTNAKKDGKSHSKKDKKHGSGLDENEDGDSNNTDDQQEIEKENESYDVIEIRLTDDTPEEQQKAEEEFLREEQSVTKEKEDSAQIIRDIVNEINTEEIIAEELTEEDKKRSKSESSNSTIEESIIVNKLYKPNPDKDDSSETISNNKSLVPNGSENGSPEQQLVEEQHSPPEQEQVQETEQDQNAEEEQQKSNEDEEDHEQEKLQSICLHNQDEPKDDDNEINEPTAITGAGSNGELPKSCMSRRSSSKSSIRKKVNINDSTEVIPSSELPSIDDDEVFSDSVPAKLPRGDMCAPYVTKRGSIPGCFELPEWFNNEDSEYGGVLEPPVTPVGRDELALRRHRMYSELLCAAQAAVEHRVRFDPWGPDVAAEDCDPDLKPSATAELENLVIRLEKLVDRLERSVSARELEIANRTFDSVIENKRRSFDIETAELPPIPEIVSTTGGETFSSPPPPPLSPGSASKELIIVSESLDQRIDKLEYCLNNINENFKKSSSSSPSPPPPPTPPSEGSLDNIPTVLDDYLPKEEESIKSPTINMSIAGYQDIVNGPLSQFINLSNKIGGDVALQSQFVKQAFDAQLQFVTLATQISQPQQNKLMELLKPTSDQIAAIQGFREKHRSSALFNHLSAISESIPALGWVCVAPTPGPHVKEMNDAGQFYTNRVLKDWKDKNVTHVEWARSWVQTLTDLQSFIKQYHTTGLVWSGKGGAPPPPPPTGCPPPPPPPVMAFDDLSLGAGNDERSALFAQINQGEGITRNLKKVTSEMQTHKNPTLRTGPAPFKAPQSFGGGPAAPQLDKEPVFNRDGKKWIIEYQKNNPSLLVENAEMNNVVYMFRCQNSTLTVKGKINSIVLDSCKKCSILFDSVVSSIEFVNCQSMQMQVLGKVPTVSIDKTDGCQMYLSKDSLHVEIISSKSSEMNVLIPKDNGEYVEQPIPEQYKTTIKGNSLQTICVESLG